MSRFIGHRLNQGSMSAGVIFISLGTVLSAVCNLALIGIVARNYELADSALFIAWWATVNIAPLGLGLVEITLARKILNFAGKQQLRVPKQLVGEGITLASLLFLIMGIGSIGITNKQDVSGSLYLLSLLLFTVLTLIQVLQRGHALSQKKFIDTGIYLGLDGISRFLISVPLIFVYEIEIQHLIVIASITPLVSIAFLKLKVKTQFNFPRSRKDFLVSKELLRMSTAVIGTVMISYLVAPWFASQVQSPKLVALFIASLTLSRIPLQFSGAFFSPFMVHLAALYESGDVENAKKLEIKVFCRAGILAILFVPAYVLVAPILISVYLGFDPDLSNWVTFGQALVAGLLLFGSVVQASLVAQNRWPLIASAWLPAIFFMGICFILPIDKLWIAVVGPILAATFVLLRMILPMWKESLT